MIGCGFFDEKQPPEEAHNTVPCWVSLHEICAFLEISPNIMSPIVQQAYSNGERWVKKEQAKDGKTLYLVDTQHEMYQSYQEMWKQHNALLGETASQWSQADQSYVPPPHSWESSPSYAPAPLPWYTEGVLQQWPRFRQWLYAHGIKIFQNLLAEERHMNAWEWQWGELQGEGFASDEEAIIAVLQSRFEAYEAEIADLQRIYDANEAKWKEQEDDFFRLLEQQKLQQSPLRRFWSGKGN
ncbi:hypothetical protein [Tengunoibacter tsumagoiensis]|nr:hypothetical protein [Tengunoibacter tsumagoiensis]